MINLATRLLTVSLFFGFSTADFCQDNFTLSDLPQGILAEVLNLVTVGTLSTVFGCDDDITIQDEDVKLWLYTRTNPNDPLLLDVNTTDKIDPKKPIHILIHGWLCNVTNDRMPELKDAYLKRYDSNVIGLDWSKLSIDFYSSSYCYVPKIGEVLGKYLCNLHEKLNVDIGKIHVLGHSMGGQLAAFIGQETVKQCNQKLGRITGLDPAGPLYPSFHDSEHLDKSDAVLVDVIHTNQAFLGYYGNCGSVDFYPNCGTFQDGCFKVDNLTSLEDILEFPTRYFGCNHLRSIDYMIESISSPKFLAKSCLSCPGLPVLGGCIADNFWGPPIPMGEDCPVHPPFGTYTLDTNDEAPFAKG